MSDGQKFDPNLDIRNLRTYEEDIKNALDDGHVTTTDIVLAEQKKRQASVTMATANKEQKLFAEAAPAKPKNLPMIFAGIVLLALGGGGIYYAMKYDVPFWGTSNKPAVNVTLTNETLRSDKTVTITTQNKTLRDIVGGIRTELKKQNQLGQEGILDINIVKNVEVEANGQKTIRTTKINSADFFEILESSAPESLMRSFAPEFIIGIHELSKPEPFILLQTNDFEQSFAGMLAWEKSGMIADVRDIFYANLGSSQSFQGEATPTSALTPNATVSTSTINTIETSTTTATTTTATTTVVIKNTVVVQGGATYDPQKFVDLVLLNKDARGVQDFTGKLLLFYTFIDKKNLLITTNPQTLEMVQRQLNITSLIR